MSQTNAVPFSAHAVARASQTVGTMALAPRVLRVLAQVSAFVLLLLAPAMPVHALLLFAMAQVTVGAAVHALHRSVGVENAVRRTLRVWAIGAVIGLSIVPVLTGAAGLPLVSAQVVLIAAVLLVGVLGTARDNFNAAGAALDGILATLPPQATGWADSAATASKITT